MSAPDTALAARRANDPCQTADGSRSEHTSQGPAGSLPALADAPNVDWRRVLSRYLAVDGDPVTSWLGELDARLDAATGDALPLFGSDRWVGATGPVRLRSALRAAEAWRRAALYAAADLADEVDAAAPDAQEAAADTSYEWARLARWVADNRGAATYAELTARRAVPARPAVPAW